MNKELKDRINSLSEIKRQFLQEKLVNNYSSKQASKLIGYFTSSDDLQIDKLRAHIKEVMPDYMVPGELQKVASIPRLPNGKVDRRSLQGLVEKKKTVAPVETQALSELERILMRIWTEVLGQADIAIDDNFFEIGGDSISSIRVLSKARNESINIKPNQIFDHPTIRELAGNVSIGEAKSSTYDASFDGVSQLTPIQHWFFTGKNDYRNYWNQGYEIGLKKPVVSNRIIDIFFDIVSNHSALRQTFTMDGKLLMSKHSNFDKEDFIHFLDVNNDQEFIVLQEETNLAKGPLIKLILDNRKEVSSLTIIAHHLIIDMVSWSLLINELDTRLGDGNKQLSTPNQFYNWATAINSSKAQETFSQETTYWLEHNLSGEELTVSEKDIDAVEFSVSEAILARLRSQALATYSSKFDELIFTAFLQALSTLENESQLQVWLESHGRKESVLDIDLNEAIGWFTSYYPQVFKLKTSMAEDIIAVKEQLRRIPNDGTGYGYLAYVSKQLKPSSTSDFIFNYGGQLASEEYSNLHETKFLKERVRHAESPAVSKIEFNCLIQNKELSCTVRYNRNRYEQASINAFISDFQNKLNSVIEHCQSVEQTFTPSDFMDADISSEDLDNLFDQL